MSISFASAGLAATKKVQTPKATIKRATVPKTQKSMLVWQPYDNKMFETFSYLPPLSEEQINKNVDYIVGNKWTPCIEFANPEIAYIANPSCLRMNVYAGYYDNRYWTMWKLPMFGCQDGSEVIKEMSECATCFPDAYIRLVCFDSDRQVQVLSFLIHRPNNDFNYCPVDQRSVGI